MRAAEGGAQGSSLRGQRRGRGLGLHEVGAQGESWGPWRGRNGPVPQFCLLYFEGPRPQASSLGAAEAAAAVWGRAATPGVRTPASRIRIRCCCRQLRAAAGQVWGADLRPLPEEAPQRMSGAERSLVTVGRSFTVAKGFVPLGTERSG